MATETRNDFIDRLHMPVWIGSGIAANKYHKPLDKAILWGLNRNVSVEHMMSQEKWLRESGLGVFTNKQLTMNPDKFPAVARARMKELGVNLQGKGGMDAYVNQLSSSQMTLHRAMKSEQVRKMAAQTYYTRFGKRKAMGYFHRSVWKKTAGDPLARRALFKAQAGVVGRGINRLLTAGWQAGLMYEIGKAAVTMLRQTGRDARKMNWGSPIQVTEGMYTERQRAVQAITSSRMSSRAAIGGEAALMHR